MKSKKFDIAVIGGGVHGVGAAQAAAAAGYSAALLEMNEIAGGTSSRSSKLIHGGLRYLETAQLSLVRECLLERELLLKNAPGLVELKKVFIPVYEETVRPSWLIRIGLSLYYLLSGFNSDSAFISLPQKEWGNLDGIDTKGLKSVFQYHEAQTDDALLTKAVMKSALELGAELFMPAKFTEAIFENGGWSARFEANGRQTEIRASSIINAAGPWANSVLNRVVPRQKEASVDIVQGSHIIIEGEMKEGIYYVEAPEDRRGVFIMPWKGKTLIGTTEKDYKGDPSNCSPLEEEIEYLFKTACRYFPRFKSNGLGGISDSFSGLRVLPSGSGTFFKRSRETVLHYENLNKTRLISIIGGKLTSYRATGESVVNKLAPFLPSVKAKADTKSLILEE